MIKRSTDNRRACLRLWMAALVLLASLPAAWAEDTTAATAAQDNASEAKAKFEIYGAAMLDMGYQKGASHPDWFDVVRPTKLPAYKDEYAPEGNFFAGVRQSRLGFKSYIPTGLGELKTIFEFELFGTGVDAGQTTFRLRHAYGEIGQFGAGQTWSPFMDPDVFPNSVEYWGPNGMVFFRTVQARWMPLKGNTSVTIAVEKPGASADQGLYSDRVELEGMKAHFPMPDISGNFRQSGKWGHVQIAGILRRIEWEDMNNDELDLSGDAMGWGFNLSTNLKVAKDTIRASVVYGKGIQNYMNDAPVDIAIKNNFSDPERPILGKPVPVFAIVAFYDHTWSDKFTSTIGYSMLDMDNLDGQADDAFHRGHYGLANVLYYPISDFFIGPEIQWGRRENFRDGWSYDDVRIQVSAKFTFKTILGGK
jgi:hypothetical protein